MIAHRKKKANKKSVSASGQLSADKSISSNLASRKDYIKEVLNDISEVTHMLQYFKEAILSDCFKEVINIRLDELLDVLTSVINKHQNLNSVDIQHAAEMLAAKVKAVNFTEVNEDNKNNLFQEVFSSVETLTFTFGDIFANFLMGHVHRLPVFRENKSFENISVDSVKPSNEPGNFSPVELDNVLLKDTDCIELAFSYAKTWSKYTKNIVSWIEQKLNLELESTRNIIKLAEATTTNIGLEEFTPLQSVFTSVLLNDVKNSLLLEQRIAALQANEFVQPLLGRKNKIEKQRKEIKELWKQEQNKMLKTETALKKAKLLCMQRQDEYEKAKYSVFCAEKEHQCTCGGLAKNPNKQLEKNQRLEAEALQKVKAANELYKVCVTNVEKRQNDLENTKREILTQLRTLVFQCDLILKAVTVNLFQMQHLQAASLANSLDFPCDSAKLYDPGQEYSEFVKATKSTEEEKVDGNVNKPLTNSSQMSRCGPSHSLKDVVCLPDSCNKIEEDRLSFHPDLSDSSFIRLWTFGMFSDLEYWREQYSKSLESGSLDSESINPGDFHQKLPQTPFSGTMPSADDLDEREPPSPLESEPSSLGAFKKPLMSKAAVTHKFRKLKSPSKCRYCEGIVVFQGVKCKECLLVCHNKCMENLVIFCGHRKLLGKTHLFGAEFTRVTKKEPDGIPFILKICASEIEKRALCLQGIYRVSGNKAKTAKLCQALENGMHLVDMSEFNSHDICEALKLYLRQLPEPLILFRWYKEFMDLAQEIQHINEEQDTKNDNPKDKTNPNTCVEINRILLKSKVLLRQLPTSNFNSLHYLIIHLKRVVDHSEENLMNSKNLGVVFGPCLMRPRPATAPVTISSSLAAYANQALLVEFLITNSQMIFDEFLESQNVTCSTGVIASLVDKSCPSKPVISPEHSTKSQYFSSKEDIHTADSESENFESTTSVEESEWKQNALEICDAYLIDNKELESLSRKMDDMCKTTEPLSLKSDVATNDIQRHTPTTKIGHAILSVDRFHLVSSPSERNVGNVNSDKFCKNLAFEGLNSKDTPTTVCSKFYGFDQQFPQKTQGQQCEQKNLTGRSAVIVPSALQEKMTMSIRVSGDHSIGATKPNTPARSAREASERRSSHSYHLAPARAARTLQPHHWTTFYKPRTPTSKVRGTEERSASPSAAVPPSTVITPLSHVEKSLPEADSTSAYALKPAPEPKEHSEEHGRPDVNPMCQGLRLKQMEELQDLEVELPQFV
ncbi:rho GTPase-activating protein 29-like isoform X6 [Ictidomys tridecemlineatus]